MYVNKYAVAAFFAVTVLPISFAQVTTSCQPLNATCPIDQGLETSSYFIDFTKVASLPSDWAVADYETVNFGPNGAELTFAKRYDAPLIRSNFHFFFGSIEYVVQGAPGKGIVSSMVLLSDDLDEIDWEMTGTGGSQIETNYYGKGFVNYAVSQYVDVGTPQSQFHTYGLQWSSEALIWSIDNVVVRTLTPSEAGDYFPQTPMHVSLSLWDGGDPSEPSGTKNWAGGETTMPPAENYTMYIKSVKIENAMPGGGYQYTDRSGSWQSIKVLSNNTRPISSSSSASNIFSMGPSTDTIISANKPAPFGLATTTPSVSASIPLKTTSLMTSTLASASLMNTKAIAPVASSMGSLISNLSVSTTSASSLSNTKASASISPLPMPSASGLNGTAMANKVVNPMSTPPGMTETSTPLPKSTQASVITEIVYTTLTSCPVTNTITSNGIQTQQVTTEISTVIRTSTSIICTKCVAPVMSPKATSPVAQVSSTSPGSTARSTTVSSPTSSPSPARLDSPASSHSPTSSTPSYSLLPASLNSSSESIFPTSSSTVVPLRSTAPITTQELVISELVYTTVTTCPVTNTITPFSGTPTLQVTTSVSTILSTSISTVCTKCIAPSISAHANTIASSLSVSLPVATTSASMAESKTPAVTSTLATTSSAVSANASMTSDLSYHSSQPAVVTRSSVSSPSISPVSSLSGSSLTQVSTSINFTSTNSQTAIFTPMSETPASLSLISESAASASASGTATFTSSVTISETSTMTAYTVSPTAWGQNATNLTGNATIKATPAPFQGAASNSSSPAPMLALLMAVAAAFFTL